MLRALVSLVLLCATQTAGAQAHCFNYEADGVELTGTLMRRIFPGPPNYESIKAGDRADSVWVLRLRQSIRVNSLGVFAAQRRIGEVQLIVSEVDHRRMRTYLDHTVVFRGNLKGAEWGWHHLPVVFWAKPYIVVLKISK